MRKIYLLTICITLLFQTNVCAEQTPMKKLSRGVINVITSPFEIPKQARAYWIKGAQVTDHIIVWVICGTVKGIVEDTKRFASGLWDVVTFPINVPSNYEPLLKPYYVFQEWPSDPDVFIFKRKQN